MRIIHILVTLSTIALAISATAQPRTNDGGKKTDKLDNSGQLNDPFKKKSSKPVEHKSSSSPNSIKIGSQTWTAANLDVTTFRNGDAIREVKTDAEWLSASKQGDPAWCYYNNDVANGSRYGKLYNLPAVLDPRGLAPAGWHMPGVDEWNALSSFMRSANISRDKVRSSSNDGFAFVSGGYREDNNGVLSFNGEGNKGYWWSGTEIGKAMGACWGFYLDAVSYSFGKAMYGNDGLCVRLVKD